MPKPSSNPTSLRNRAELKLKTSHGVAEPRRSEADTRRILHELEVHQIELEMQNAELQESRDKVEALLETYTDLYDFAPVGYYSVDEQSLILEVNLTGAALLGVDRAHLIKRRLLSFATPKSLGILQAFFKKIFTEPGKQICVVSLMNQHGTPFWADLQATPAMGLKGTKKWCRVVVSDLTTLKQAEEVLERMEGLATANRELKIEIVHRQMAELALKKGEAEALHMQEQLRHLSRQLLLTQEEERKRISRELHDEIVQTLVGINVHLASLTVKDTVDIKDLRAKIIRTQQLVEKSVEIVHRFARELRPTVLDDLGLIPALQSFIKDFTKRTDLKIKFTAFPGVEKLNSTQLTVLYRVAQSALANVDKHARAQNVTVSIRKRGYAIRMEIHDDGKSFDVQRVLLAKRHKRLGLLGSRERVEMVGGKFDIISSPNLGTTLSAEIPFVGEDQKGASTTPGKSTSQVKS